MLGTSAIVAVSAVLLTSFVTVPADAFGGGRGFNPAGGFQGFNPGGGFQGFGGGGHGARVTVPNRNEQFLCVVHAITFR